MLVGYVSDENHVALAGVEFEFENDNCSVGARSTVTGAVRACVEPGSYQVTLGKPGYGSKRVTLRVAENVPHLFRMLSDRLYGFMWPKWVRAGGVSEYCVSATEEFRLELWRYGWEKQFVRSLGWCDEHGPRSMVQVTPDGDYTQTGVQWNRVGHSLEFQKHAVVAPGRSGLYYLHAKTRSGSFCSFPWIVMPTAPTADIAVMTANMTWNAYNKFGGRSNYFNQAGLPDRPVVNARQDLERYTRPGQWPYEETAAPLSFQRPEPASEVGETDRITDPIPGRVGSCFAPGEWRLLGWLEREGFAFDLYSETELHFERLPLDRYKVLVLNNHPEYWSHEMYHQVKEWVHTRGGKLVYLGGCGLYAEVELPDEATILCRREGVFDQRGESSVELLGVEYSHTGFQSGAPYRVLAADHWAFQGTGLANGDLFGQASLHERCPGGASAHELDKIGVGSPAGLKHLAKGNNPEGSGADLVTFETASDGAVFSVGSLCWTLSLVVDDRVSAITGNVLRKFLA